MFNIAYLDSAPFGESQSSLRSLVFTFRTTVGHLVQYSFPLDSNEVGRWRDIVVRHDGKALDVFVDSKLRLSKPSPAPIAIPDAPLRIGATVREGKPIQQFHGDMETVALWTEAIPDDQIAKLTIAR